MIFEVKMDFGRKARFVANGAKTPDLTTTNYTGVVSWDTVRITLTYTAFRHCKCILTGANFKKILDNLWS